MILLASFLHFVAPGSLLEVLLVLSFIFSSNFIPIFFLAISQDSMDLAIRPTARIGVVGLAINDVVRS